MPSQCSKCGALWLSSEEPLIIKVTTKTLARHQELLTTNAPPEEAEAAFIRAVVSKSAARLADVEGETTRLRARLEQLEDECASLSRYHAQHEVILSPLRRMPPEILGEIFSWTLPSLREGMSRSRQDIADSPWVLTHISSRWRAAALSTPSLWSLVVLEFHENSSYSIPMLQTQIARAHALRINLYGYESMDPRSQIEIFQCLADRSARWEELFIELTSDLVPLLGALEQRLPLLRKLQVAVQSIQCFQTASALFDVRILNEYRHVPILLPAHQLTQYTLDGPWEVHRGILKLTRNLVEASVFVRFDNEEPWPEDAEIINLMCLQRLFVSHPEVMRYLKAPALHAISIRVIQSEEPIHHLEPFLLRSSCNLRTLGLQGSPNSLQVVAILRQVPSIITLGILVEQLDASAETDALISHLTITEHTGSALHLTKISFGCQERTSVDYAAYLRMLQSRWKSENGALRSAALFTNEGPKLDEATARGLDLLRRDGLDFSSLEGPEAKEVMNSWIMSL
ncbi:hypothetical protein DFH09DRAFT_1284992 [Mycena vulgaris]|nr:hypothetical protein DFH09DRAFT_1284992 [Mycena vulgaris]